MPEGCAPPARGHQLGEVEVVEDRSAQRALSPDGATGTGPQNARMAGASMRNTSLGELGVRGDRGRAAVLDL